MTNTVTTPALARAADAIDTAYDVHTGLAHWERVQLLARAAVSAALDDPDLADRVARLRYPACFDDTATWFSDEVRDRVRANMRRETDSLLATVRAAILGEQPAALAATTTSTSTSTSSPVDQGTTYAWKGIRFQAMGKGKSHCKAPGCGRIAFSYMSHAEWHLTGNGEEGH